MSNPTVQEEKERQYSTTTMTTIRLYETFKKQERLDKEGIPYVTVRYCYYNDPEMYTEVVPVKELNIDQLIKNHTSDKVCLIERPDGATLRVIDNGFFNVAIHNHKNDSYNSLNKWLYGLVDEFPPCEDTYKPHV